MNDLISQMVSAQVFVAFVSCFVMLVLGGVIYMELGEKILAIAVTVLLALVVLLSIAMLQVRGVI